MLETVADTQGIAHRVGRTAVPKNVADMDDRACRNCNGNAKFQEPARLLLNYSDVFSYGDEVVCHEMPLADRTTSISQPN